MLPDDLLIEVLSFLPNSEFYTIRRTCKSINDLLQIDYFNDQFFPLISYFDGDIPFNNIKVHPPTKTHIHDLIKNNQRVIKKLSATNVIYDDLPNIEILELAESDLVSIPQVPKLVLNNVKYEGKYNKHTVKDLTISNMSCDILKYFNTIKKLNITGPNINIFMNNLEELVIDTNKFNTKSLKKLPNLKMLDITTKIIRCKKITHNLELLRMKFDYSEDNIDLSGFKLKTIVIECYNSDKSKIIGSNINFIERFGSYDLYNHAKIINFLLMCDGSAVLRYSS